MKDIEIFKEALNVEDVEAYLVQQEDAITGDEIDDFITHDFSDGIYVRTVFVPAGHLIIGKRHRFDTCNILLKGKISIYTDEKTPIVHLEGPYIFTSTPGTKKLGYAHTDVYFSNIHPTRETDLKKIENTFIIPKEEYMKSLSTTAIDDEVYRIRQDYEKWREETGFSQEYIDGILKDSSDVLTGSPGDGLVYGPSKIHGTGIFSTVSFKTGQFIGSARLNKKRTPMGRYTNHSSNPNVAFKKVCSDSDGDLVVIAVRDIYENDELFVDYKQVGTVNGNTY